MTAPEIPRPLARRIDRLARQAHAFHRHAHHPLCDPYRQEVLRVGRRLRLCKGCAFLAVGFALGFAVGVVISPAPRHGAIAIGLACVLGLLSLRVRLPKLIGRMLPGACLGLAFWAGWACALGAGVLVLLCGLLYRRRGVERSRCTTCHERERQPCSGFVLMVRRERAFQRKANRWLGDWHGGGPIVHGHGHGSR